jgi:hypothetical protein
MEMYSLLTYLEEQLQEDGDFLLTHQNELDPENPEQKEIYEVTQGKIDMCRQVLSYLETVRHHPEVLDELKQAA